MGMCVYMCICVCTCVYMCVCVCVCVVGGRYSVIEGAYIHNRGGVM